MTALDAMQAELRRDGDKRHRSAKQAEALTEICRRSLARDHKPTSELSRRRGLPHVSYIVDLKDYETTHPDLVADIRIEAEHVGALSRTTLDRIMCDCEINRIITDGPSVIIDVGRTTRNVPDKLWHALVARDRHCQAPAATAHPHGAKPTTSGTGPTADPPTSTTSNSCAGTTTAKNTSTTPSNENETLVQTTEEASDTHSLSGHYALVPIGVAESVSPGRWRSPAC